ncbi:MAG: hypothetical protein ABSG15_15475, partial [FCB group bacterium]
DGADVVSIAKALIPGKNNLGGTPGFIEYNTHGGQDGTLTTGDKILEYDKKNFPKNIISTHLPALKQKLSAEGLDDLLTYPNNSSFPTTVRPAYIEQNLRPGFNTVFWGLKPKFWEWVQKKHGADFSKSLVYMSACLTDSTPDLREAVKAKAYFAFKKSVSSGFAGAVFQYFCKSLVRPTHSAEEVYYNLIRVANTQQMIYVEDKVLDGQIFEPKGETPWITMQSFPGYGYDGEEIIPYQTAGWFDTSKVNAGAVWWLLFAGRWGQDADGGSTSLQGCWNDWWKDGNMPGLGDPGCNAATPGKIPSDKEVDYAIYLLTGKTPLGTKNFKNPRWTLNDGK